MIQLEKLKGVVVPMITPLQPDGAAIHERGVHQLVDFLIGQGVHGVFPGGTTGEIWALDDEQWSRLIRFTVEAARGRAPVYAGVSQPSTAGALARAKMAEKLGADLVVSLAPYYVPPSQADIIRHFQALAAATGLPVLIYQFPGIVKTSITLPTYAQLAEIPNVVGVKDSQADVTEFRHMINLLRANGRDFRMFLGSDILADCAVLMGAQGVVPSIANVLGGWLVKAYDHAVAGEWAASREILTRVTEMKAMYRLVNTGSVFNGLIPGLKAALELLGVEAGPPAAPMTRFDAEKMKAMETLLRKGGVLE